MTGSWFQVSGFSTAIGQGASSQIENETFEKANPAEADKYRISNHAEDVIQGQE